MKCRLLITSTAAGLLGEAWTRFASSRTIVSDIVCRAHVYFLYGRKARLELTSTGHNVGSHPTQFHRAGSFQRSTTTVEAETAASAGADTTVGGNMGVGAKPTRGKKKKTR
eukprot:COSAG02_NODE_7307_length_3073_cov_1.494620_3_plen_111_part_00